MGMSLAIVKWLQRHDDEKLRKSIDIFTEFLLRECVDEEDGTCYGNIGKDKSNVRLYNAPWVMLYFTELYKLTNEKRWIELAFASFAIITALAEQGFIQTAFVFIQCTTRLGVPEWRMKLKSYTVSLTSTWKLS